jgi:arylsulfatase A-like enzyme
MRLSGWLLLCWAVWGSVGAAAERRPDERPNLILILVDDLGKEWVSCYGADGVETPHIDAIARGGMRFENAYSMPQCTPSRLALLTGQYPYRNGWVNHWDVPRWGAGCHFDPAQYPAVLGRALRRLGYATAVAGKWQIDDFRVEPRGLDSAGFDQWCMWTGGEGGNPASHARYWDPYVVRHDAPASTRQGAFGPDLYHRFVLDFITAHREQPFFVYYSMTLVHTPLVATPAEPDAQGKLAKHVAMVRYMDALVGQLNAHLRTLELEEQTIVLWTTDNGTNRAITGSIDGRRVPGGKAQTTENGINAPLIAYGPTRIPAGVASEALVDFTDFLPTLVDLAGGSVSPEAVDGCSFAAVLRGEAAASERDWILAMGGQNNAAVTEAGVQNEWVFRDRVFRNERFKAFVDTDRQVVKLVDLVRDPGERENLLGDPPPQSVAFLQSVREAVAAMPEKDADPRYTPNPAQSWDRPVTEPADRWKRGVADGG